MTKQQLYYLCLISSLLFIAPKTYAQVDSLNLRWDISNTCQSDTLIAQLKANGLVTINALQLSINWNTTNFQYINYTIEQLSNIVVGDNQIESGQLSLAWSSSIGQAFTSDKALLTIRFLPKKCGINNDEIIVSNRPVLIRAATILPNGKVEIVPVSIQSNSFTISTCLTLAVTSDETSFCVGDSVKIEAFCKDCQYEWSNGEQGSSITVSQNGIYQVIANTAENCAATDSISIEFASLPFLALGNDTTICQTDYEISAITDSRNTISWNTGEITKNITISQSGTYSATVIDQNNCTNKDTIDLILGATLTAAIGVKKDLLCPGDSLVLMPLEGDFVTWRDTSTTLIRATEGLNAIVRPINNTTYFLTVENECAIDSTSITIEVLETTTTAGNDTCISAGLTIQLNAKNALSYQWLPNEYPVSNPTIATPSVNPNKSTFYVLEALDENNCMVKDSVNILVADNPLLSIEKINFITPNDDGFNDFLEFKNLEKFRANSLKVFNRQGVLVYDRVDYQKDEERWRGNLRDTDIPLPSGVYFYVLKVNEIDLKQTLNLIR